MIQDSILIALTSIQERVLGSHISKPNPDPDSKIEHETEFNPARDCHVSVASDSPPLLRTLRLTLTLTLSASKLRQLLGMLSPLQQLNCSRL